MDYKKYVGQYVKRFYAPFAKGNIWAIGDYREVTHFEGDKPSQSIPEFQYSRGREQFWADVDDSVIITNEDIISKDVRVANVNHPDYKGYNPFTENIEGGRAGRIYDVLVTSGGAQESMRNPFLSYHADAENDGHQEWRFSGKLGFGGKYYYENDVVDCYPEDLTAERRKLISDINKTLSSIK